MLREDVAMTDRSRRFTATVVNDSKRRVVVPLPFVPDDAWGRKPAHQVAGEPAWDPRRLHSLEVRMGHGTASVAEAVSG